MPLYFSLPIIYFKSHGNSALLALCKHEYSKTPLTKLSPNPVIIQISKYSSIGMDTMQRYREMHWSFRLFQQDYTSLIGFLTGGVCVCEFFYSSL